MRLPWQARKPPLSERITEALLRGGVLVNDLTISADGSRVIVRGAVPSPLVRERAIQLTSAVAGVRSVDDRLTVLAPPADPLPGSAGKRTREPVYVARAGDTLESIAEKLFGNRTRWQELGELNRGVVSDPRILQPGLRLRVPRD
ncbi:MAG: BON domain-containing protein [Gemmatimonadaceae bacterium]